MTYNSIIIVLSSKLMYKTRLKSPTISELFLESMLILCVCVCVCVCVLFLANLVIILLHFRSPFLEILTSVLCLDIDISCYHREPNGTRKWGSRCRDGSRSPDLDTVAMSSLYHLWLVLQHRRNKNVVDINIKS